ncbi:hypothetical protein RSOLAG1IB_11417 [Rhizoctonia solani AG-1 IB]|uniref:Uncharacterized protein n=1 Tax=Thanatephorus cucumeris (strain AG1-IB / isolate 7/3/14) TaxID=1108050 RepID=A0A0B7F7F5_THACB|nr:hypothetical protein RSOLAG1IB_11417 [Rhizoctonia solani AG-1 IB]
MFGPRFGVKPLVPGFDFSHGAQNEFEEKQKRAVFADVVLWSRAVGRKRVFRSTHMRSKHTVDSLQGIWIKQR